MNECRDFYQRALLGSELMLFKEILEKERQAVMTDIKYYIEVQMTQAEMRAIILWKDEILKLKNESTESK